MVGVVGVVVCTSADPRPTKPYRRQPLDLGACDYCPMRPREVTLRVVGWPPAKNEAKSLFAVGHSHFDRVTALLEAARRATQGHGDGTAFGSRPIGLELTVSAPNEPPADATNFLGGVGDVLEVKDRRALLKHLGDLAHVGLYENDRHIHEVRYRWREAPEVGYVVRLWALGD